MRKNVFIFPSLLNGEINLLTKWLFLSHVPLRYIRNLTLFLILIAIILDDLTLYLVSEACLGYFGISYGILAHLI